MGENMRFPLAVKKSAKRRGFFVINGNYMVIIPLMRQGQKLIWRLATALLFAVAMPTVFAQAQVTDGNPNHARVVISPVSGNINDLHSAFSGNAFFDDSTKGNYRADFFPLIGGTLANYQWQYYDTTDDSIKEVPTIFVNPTSGSTSAAFISSSQRRITLYTRQGVGLLDGSTYDALSGRPLNNAVWSTIRISLRVRIEFERSDGQTLRFYSPWIKVQQPASHPNGAFPLSQTDTDIIGGSQASGYPGFGFADPNGVGFVYDGVWQNHASFEGVWQARRSGETTWADIKTITIAKGPEGGGIPNTTAKSGAPATLAKSALATYFATTDGEVRFAVTMTSDSFGHDENVAVTSTPIPFFRAAATEVRSITIINAAVGVSTLSFQSGATWSVSVGLADSAAGVLSYQWQRSQDGKTFQDIPSQNRLALNGVDVRSDGATYTFYGARDPQAVSNPKWDPDYEWVRVQVSYTDSGNTSNYFSEVVRHNRLGQGQNFAQFTSTDAYSSRLNSNLVVLNNNNGTATDDNGIATPFVGQYVWLWRYADGTTGGATLSTPSRILSADELANPPANYQVTPIALDIFNYPNPYPPSIFTIRILQPLVATLSVYSQLHGHTLMATSGGTTDANYAIEASLIISEGPIPPALTYTWQFLRPPPGTNVNNLATGDRFTIQGSALRNGFDNARYISVRAQATYDEYGITSTLFSDWLNIIMPTSITVDPPILSLTLTSGHYGIAHNFAGLDDGNGGLYHNDVRFSITWEGKKGNAPWHTVLASSYTITITKPITQPVVSQNANAFTNVVVGGSLRAKIQVVYDRFGFSNPPIYTAPIAYTSALDTALANFSASISLFINSSNNKSFASLAIKDPDSRLGVLADVRFDWTFIFSADPANTSSAANCADFSNPNNVPHTFKCGIGNYAAIQIKNRNSAGSFAVGQLTVRVFPYDLDPTTPGTLQIDTPALFNSSANFTISATLNFRYLGNYNPQGGQINQLNFIYQSGPDPAGTANWQDFGRLYGGRPPGSGTASTFLTPTLSNGRFGGDTTHLRIIALDNSSLTLTMKVFDVTQPTGGTIEIDFLDAPYRDPGAQLTPMTSALTDGNGVGNITNAIWTRKSNSEVPFVTVGFDQIYAIRPSDFVNLKSGERPIFRVMIEHIDQLGFTTTVSGEVRVDLLPPPPPPPPPAGGTVSLTLTTPSQDNVHQTYSAIVSVVGNLAAINYQWQRSRDNITYQNIGGANSESYELRSSLFGGNWNPEFSYVRFVVSAQFADSTLAVVTSAPIMFSPPSIFGQVSILRGATAEGATLTADISALSAVNITEYRYRWSTRSNDSGTYTLVSGARGNQQTYVIQTRDFSGVLNDGKPAVQLEVIAINYYGSPYSVTAVANLQRPQSTDIAAFISYNNFAVGSSFQSRVESPSGGQISYQWQQVDPTQTPPTFRNLSGGGAKSPAYILRSTVGNAERQRRLEYRLFPHSLIGYLYWAVGAHIPLCNAAAFGRAIQHFGYSHHHKKSNRQCPAYRCGYLSRPQQF